jgi:hypothetical protein
MTIIKMTKEESKFFIEWLALLLSIREVTGSNLGPETAYPHRGFSCFSPVLLSICCDSMSNEDTTAAFHSKRSLLLPTFRSMK